MQLQKQFQNDLVVLTLNVDFDGEGEPSLEVIEKVSQTLTRLNITGVNYIASSPMEEMLSEFELFGLPAAILYSRDGQVAEKWDGEVDIEQEVKNVIIKIGRR